MSTATYRAGILGLGMIGGADQESADRLGQRVADMDGTHYQALSGHPRIEVVAGSSRDAGRRERFAARSGAKTYADWRELLELERPDIVSVATYAPQHAEMTIATAEHGARVVWCEKPIATTVADAERMLDACDRHGTLLVINHNRRFNPNYRRLRELIAAGGIGTLTSANLQWATGRLGNVGTHLIDSLLLLTGQRVVAVSATLDRTGRPDCRGSDFQDPGGWGLLRFENDLIATLDAGDESRTPAQLTLNGTLGRARTGGGSVELEFWDGRREDWPAPADGRSSMDRTAEQIVAWLDGDRPFAYPAREAVHTLEAIVACHVSDARSAAWVELPLRSTDRERVVQSG